MKFSLEGPISLINEYALYLKALFHFLGALFWQFKVDLQAQRTR